MLSFSLISSFYHFNYYSERILIQLIIDILVYFLIGLTIVYGHNFSHFLVYNINFKKFLKYPGF